MEVLLSQNVIVKTSPLCSNVVLCWQSGGTLLGAEYGIIHLKNISASGDCQLLLYEDL